MTVVELRSQIKAREKLRSLVEAVFDSVADTLTQLDHCKGAGVPEVEDALTAIRETLLETLQTLFERSQETQGLLLEALKGIKSGCQ